QVLRKYILVAGLLTAGFSTTVVSMRATVGEEGKPVTFTKDVLPVLQRNCQSCHRPGQIAPMSFLTYKDARPWAKAMKTAAVTKKMSPWCADPQFGHFANERSLKPEEIEIIAKWADTGAVEGDAKDTPAPVAWPRDGWEIEPDIIVNGPEFAVPANPK